MPRCNLSERGFDLPAKVVPVAHGLLEVPSGELIEVRELGCGAFEPVPEPLVEVGAGCFGHAVVGSVASEQVAKAERIVSGDCCGVWPDQLLANQSGKLRVDL